ncbi:hypothetical protein DVK00_18185 [Haloarcula sp. Atlit-47R]|uniref:hypothetical protein n=1 Tax=Haloarcula sp. Atlit-47R TaxID=2282132 RepID=UPI000EF1C7F7|nr:hypothetical protein [Haloarcula sp. Atlit-47R]RLM41992.1 hypothetical protein DVK00_18185 [Haloarcula sp. Atlit-47R]
MSQNSSIEFEHEQFGNIVVQDLTEWNGETEEISAVENEWLDIASQQEVTATITEFGPKVTLSRDTQEHLAVEWSSNAQEAGVEKIAFVSEGIKARAVSSNLDVPQEIKTFRSIEEAVNWAKI